MTARPSRPAVWIFEAKFKRGGWIPFADISSSYCKGDCLEQGFKYAEQFAVGWKKKDGTLNRKLFRAAKYRRVE